MTGRQCQRRPPAQLPNRSRPKLPVSRGHLVAFLCLHGVPNNPRGTSRRTRRLPAHAIFTGKHLQHRRLLEHPRPGSLDHRIPLTRIHTHIHTRTPPERIRRPARSPAPARDVNSPRWTLARRYDRCQTSPTRQISQNYREQCRSTPRKEGNRRMALQNGGGD